jgi:hypothetical protein
MGCAGRPNPALTGGLKSTEVVQLIEIWGLQTEETFAVAAMEIPSDRTRDLFGASGSSGVTRYRKVRSSCGRLFIGNFIPEAVLRSSTLPPGRLSSTLDTTISQFAYGVMSISKEAMIVGFVGEVFGLEYLTRALMAGYTLMAWRDMFLRGRIISLATRPDGATRETLRAESRGLTPPSEGSPPNDSSRFMPEGTWLGRYSSFKISDCTWSTGFRLAVAENTMDGF